MVSQSTSGESNRVNAGPKRDILSLGESLNLLNKLTNHLRMLSLYVFAITLINIAANLLAIVGMKFKLPIVTNMSVEGGAIIITFLSLLPLLAIVLYESQRRRADALFEEISDELQWNVGYRDREINKQVADNSPPLDARVILRSFARTTDLPLVPGKYGPSVYAAVNVFSTFFLVFSFIGIRF
jgi:hypothetical protein